MDRSYSLFNFFSIWAFFSELPDVNESLVLFFHDFLPPSFWVFWPLLLLLKTLLSLSTFSLYLHNRLSHWHCLCNQAPLTLFSVLSRRPRFIQSGIFNVFLFFSLLFFFWVLMLFSGNRNIHEMFLDELWILRDSVLFLTVCSSGLLLFSVEITALLQYFLLNSYFPGIVCFFSIFLLLDCLSFLWGSRYFLINSNLSGIMWFFSAFPLLGFYCFLWGIASLLIYFLLNCHFSGIMCFFLNVFVLGCYCFSVEITIFLVEQ